MNSNEKGHHASRGTPVKILPLLLKVLHATLKDLHILLAVNVHGYSLTAALGMCHLAQDSSIRAGDAFNGHIRAVRVSELIHGRVAVLVHILGRNLAICCQLL